MFDGIIMGQYIPGNSFIYKINPLNKIVFVFLFMLMFIIIDSLKIVGFSFLLVIFLFIIFKLPFFSVLKGLKSILFFLIITFVMHVFFSRTGEVLFEYSFITITREGLMNGLMIFLRLFSVVILNSILTLTTTPVEIAWGFEKLMYPLKIFRFPVEEFALMLSLSLRFIPVLFYEMQKIIDAQKSRGADFDSPSFFKKILSFPPILIPLFVNSFYRAEEIAMAMESRCYTGSDGRTSYNKIVFSFLDIIFFLLYISLSSLIICIYYNIF